MKKREWYEIVNPSDACVIASDDPNHAIVACIAIAEGSYGLRDPSGEAILPILAFGGDPVTWLRANVLDAAEPFKAYLDAHAVAVAEVLESISYGTASTANAVDAMLEGLPDARERRAKYNDEKRSSMSDISRRAFELAKALRTRASTTEKQR